MKQNLEMFTEKSILTLGIKYRKIEAKSRSKPNPVVSMVGKIITGFRVGKNDQIISI